MGVIGKVLGAGRAIGGVAEVFVGNRAQREAIAGELAKAAVEQYGAEFARAGASRFDGFVDGLNRLPRPLLALSTLGLFAYAMAEPGGFGTRMQSLALVPEPLWWLLGAIVSFYFGARELHHQRGRTRPGLAARRPGGRRGGAAARLPRGGAGRDRPRPQRRGRGVAPPARLTAGRPRARPAETFPAAASYPDPLQPHRGEDTMSLHMLRAALAAAVTALALLAATGGWIAAPAQAGITATGAD